MEELKGNLIDGENQIVTLRQALTWEVEQETHEAKASEFEMESAQLELEKIINGDGPLEKARLHAAMQKAEGKYEDLNSFTDDLVLLEEQGFLNATEVRQTQKKLQEEKESYENAKLQYDSFVNHVFPMNVKKAESSIKRLVNKQEEARKNCLFKIGKAQGALSQAEQHVESIKRQIRDAQYELQLTEIRAPSSGMVVLRDDYRSGQKRKPRVEILL